MVLKDKKICYSNGLPDHIQIELLKKESEWEKRGMFKYKDVKEAVLGFEKDLESITSDDFDHNCTPDYEEVIALVKTKFNLRMGNWKIK